MSTTVQHQRGTRPLFARELLRITQRDGLETKAPAPGVMMDEREYQAYSPNKTELVQALWLAALQEFDRCADELSRQKDNPLEGILALGKAYALFALERPARFNDIFQLDNGRLAAELNGKPTQENTYLTLLEWVSQAIEQGQLRHDDPELIAQTLWAGIHGVYSLLNSWTDFPFKPQELLFANMVKMLMIGVLADRPQE